VNIVIYSALFGNIDPLWSVPPIATKDATYILFTDRVRDEVGLWTNYSGNSEILPGTERLKVVNPTWEQRLVKPEMGNRRAARRLKVLAQEALPEADYSIWLDSNIRLRIAPKTALKWLGNKDIAVFKHPDRLGAFQEIAICKQWSKGNKEKLRRQGNAYLSAGMPFGWGLASTRSVIRKHTKRMQEFNNLWWEQLTKYSVRDQISFPYVCWRYGFGWSRIPGVATACVHYWYRPHQKGQ